MTSDTGIQARLSDDESGAATMSALSIIADELMETIRNAHLALEDCVDGRGGSAALVRAGELLHQVRGALQITETYGAALLAEEMELACKYLAALRAGKGREDGLDALTRSMVQLPTYIERLLGGQITLPRHVWQLQNLSWAVFFMMLGALNLYVAFYYGLELDDDTRQAIWVNFKVFGLLGLTIVFIVLQALTMAKYIQQTPEKDDT